MTKKERRLLSSWDSSATYWERRYNQTEHTRKQPDKQENQNAEAADIILFWILCIIGLLAIVVGVIL